MPVMSDWSDEYPGARSCPKCGVRQVFELNSECIPCRKAGGLFEFTRCNNCKTPLVVDPETGRFKAIDHCPHEHAL